MQPRTIAHFEILGRLGAGGMGVVYRARDRVLEREVALKVVLPEHASDKETRQRFLREARAAAVLSHPGIATIYEAGEAKGDFAGQPQLYIAQELVGGETLAERLKRGRLGVQEALGIGLQVAEALGQAHEKGVVHRDVKPSNLMVMEDGRVKVLDFGIAKWQVRPPAVGPEMQEVETWFKTGPGMLVGTPAYMAPEQIVGGPTDARADVYAAGCVLYEMLAGRPPFTAPSTAELLKRSLTETPRPLEDLRPEAGKAMVGVVARALSRDPQARYADGRQLAQALREAETASHPSVETVAAAVPAVPRHRRLAAAVLAAAALAATAWLLLERAARPALAFKERDFALVADVVNGTAEPVFDLALKSALETDLRQSRYVNVMDSSQVQSTLRLMRREPGTRLDPDLGRQVCLRAGVRALVVPRILAVGTAYEVGASLVEPSTGRVVEELRVTARGREKVLLSSIDELTKQVRRCLGESLASIARTDPPFAQYTTSSLEALSLLDVGRRAWAVGDHPKAERSFREALRYDPRFVAARGSLGLVLIQFLGRQEEGKAELARALREADQVSRREYLHLSALSKQFVLGDLEGALEDYRFISELYPDMVQPYNNSGQVLEKLGRFEDAAAMYERGHRADPRSTIPLWNAYFLYIGSHLRDPSGAERAAHALAALQPEYAYAVHAVGWSLIMQRRFAEAEDAMRATLRLDPHNPLALGNLAHMELRRGAAEEAVETYRRADEKKGGADDHDRLCLGLALRAAGRVKDAVVVMQAAAAAMQARAKGKPIDKGEEALLVALLSGAGRTGEARSHLTRLERGGEPTGATAAWLARAHVALGEPDRAAALYARAIATGVEDPYLVLIDPSLAAIRDRSEIDRLLPAGPAPGS